MKKRGRVLPTDHTDDMDGGGRLAIEWEMEKSKRRNRSRRSDVAEFGAVNEKRFGTADGRG